MLLSDCLETFVEKYLFSDLHTMRDAVAEKDDGHCGYPMLLNCAAGIELLGYFLGAGGGEPERNFLNYWRKCLYSDSNNQRYNVGSAIFQLVRNGIAHNCVVRGQVSVYKSPGPHLVLDERRLILSAGQLLQDFEESYNNLFRPIAFGIVQNPVIGDKSTMEARLAVIDGRDSNVWKQAWGSLKKLAAIQVPIPVASGSYQSPNTAVVVPVQNNSGLGPVAIVQNYSSSSFRK